MRRPLGLHHHTVNELDPVELVRLAGRAGYDRVSLFTHLPTVPHSGRESMFVFPSVTADNLREVRAELVENRLAVTGVEFFLITPEVDLSSYIAGLARGRELGAAHAMTHIFDLDRARAANTLGLFCDLAAGEDLSVCIEFCPLTPGCRSFDEAKWVVDQVARDNLGINICPLHLIRSGGTVADLAGAGGRYVINAQLNDGHGLHSSTTYFGEIHDRELPGDGDFPLLEILRALPDPIPVEVKIPCDRRKAAGVSATQFATEAAARARALADASM